MGSALCRFSPHDGCEPVFIEILAEGESFVNGPENRHVSGVNV
jgi:hypothetical protein